MHVVTRQIQGDEHLEQDGVIGVSCTQEHQQARSRTPIRDHVQHRTKLCRLVELARRVSIQGIQ